VEGEEYVALYKRGNIWWIRQDPVTGVRRSTQCRDKTAARLYEGERERLAADPTYAASHAATVGEWADKVMASKKAGKAEGTAHMYGVKLGHVVRIFGRDARLADITPPNVDAFIAQRRDEGASDSTIGKELTAIMQIAKAARRAQVFAGNVDALRPIDFKVNYVPKERVVSDAEIALLCGAFPANRAAAVRLSLATAARLSEIRRIRREDVDTSTWTVRVRGTKTTSANKPIPIPEPLRPWLLEALPFLPLPAWPRMSADVGEKSEELGMPRVTPNDLRRTTATRLIAAGVALDIVAKILRHTTPAMVFKVYGQATAEQLGTVAARQIAAVGLGTPASQSPPDGALCSSGASAGFTCDSALVAPIGLEPISPFGRGILKPQHGARPQPIRHLSRGDASTECPPDAAESRRSRTESSHSERYFQAASWLWFERRAARLAVAREGAAAGFRARSAAWFRRAA
jgi:integrase